MLDARREFLWDYPGSRVHKRILQVTLSLAWLPAALR